MLVYFVQNDTSYWNLCLLHFFVVLPRLIKTQTEVEMEDESPEGGIGEPYFTIEEDEEVVVIWETDHGAEQKDIRALAMASQEGNKKDKDILLYYRLEQWF